MDRIKQILDKLEIDGWVEIENISSENELIRISKGLGQIIPHPNGDLINKLIPNDGKTKIIGTHSHRFGFGRFPLHTDTAFWTIPARYILLCSFGINSCPTFIASTTSLFNQLNFNENIEIERAIFKIKTPNSQFYTSLFFKENNILGLRYDTSCMNPANTHAKYFVDKIENSEIKMNEITWSGNKAVIFDNWKVLHARGIANFKENRVLSRIYIKSNQRLWVGNVNRFLLKQNYTLRKHIMKTKKNHILDYGVQWALNF